MKRNFIFMCGTPRSGTSFLAGIIGRHPRIAMGVERFKFHYARKTLSPSHFDRNRFFDLRAEDTSAPERIVLPHREEIYEKYEGCQYVGDKYPNIVRHFGWIHRTFGDPVFLPVLRNPIEVARSWNVRAKREADHWPEKNDFAAGITYWTATLTHLVAARSKGMKLVPIDYDFLMNEEEDKLEAHLESILSVLDLPMSSDVLQELIAKRDKREKQPFSEEEEAMARNIVSSPAWGRFLEAFSKDLPGTPRWSCQFPMPGRAAI